MIPYGMLLTYIQHYHFSDVNAKRLNDNARPLRTRKRTRKARPIRRGQTLRGSPSSASSARRRPSVGRLTRRPRMRALRRRGMFHICLPESSMFVFIWANVKTTAGVFTNSWRVLQSLCGWNTSVKSHQTLFGSFRNTSGPAIAWSL